MKKIILLCIVIFTVSSLLAQNKAKEFYISSFKLLEMDLDARTLHPVIDQNGKKAALIKVVTTETGFDFDIGIMGITEVHQESGEIWVYIPEKAQRITIRHPKYGVIRDYFFPIEIESASTYEMRLKTPLTQNSNEPQKLIIEHKFATSPGNALPISNQREVKKSKSPKKIENRGFLLLAEIGADKSPSYGIRAAYYKQLGGYVNFRSNFKSTKGDYICFSDGSLENGSSIWTTGKEGTSRLNICAGAITQITEWLSIYAGAGYGKKSLVWEDVNEKWAEVDDFSFKGIALDAGAVFTIKRLSISAGINSIAFDWCEFSLGFGIRF